MRAFTAFIAVLLALALLPSVSAVLAIRQNTITSGEQSVQNFIFNNMTVVDTNGLAFFSYVLNETDIGGVYQNQAILLNAQLLGHFSFEYQPTENDTKAVAWRGSNVPNIFNATVVGGNNITELGKYGRGMQFDGVNDFLNITYGGINFWNGTVSMWVKRNDTSTALQFLYRSYTGAGGTFATGFGSNKYDNCAYPNDLNWHYVTTVLYNATTSRCYVDGVPGGYSGQTVLMGATETVIGTYSDWENLFFFNGTIDEVRIWNRTFTDLDVKYQFLSDLRRYPNAAKPFIFTINETGLLKGAYHRGFDANNSAFSIAHSAYPLNFTQIYPTDFMCFDEQNPTLRLNFNTTVAGTTNYYNSLYLNLTTPVTDSIIGYSINEFTGTYLPRVFQLNGNQTSNNTCYLLKSTASSIVRIRVLTYGDLAIANALVNVSRTFGGVLKTVDMQYSDMTGTATFYLDPLASYTFVITATGYQTAVVTFQPSTNDYRIYLTSGSSFGSASSFNNVTYWFTPGDFHLNISQSEPISFSLTDLDGNLSYYGLYIYWNNTLVFYQKTTSSSGGTISTTVNTTKYQGAMRLAVTGFFKKTGFNEFNVSVSMGITDTTPRAGTLSSIFKGFSQRTNSTIMPILGILSLIIAALAGVFVSGSGSFVGGGAVSVVILGGAVLMGWLPFLVWTTTAVVVGAIMLLRGRI